MISLIAKQLVYLLMVTISIFTIIYFYPFEQAHWTVWSGLFFALLTTGSYFFERIKIIFLTAMGVIFTIGVVNYLGIVITTVWLIFLGQRYPRYAYSFFIINVFAILANYYPPVGGDYLEKAEAIGLGVTVVLVAQLIFAYPFKQDKWMIQVLSALSSLQRLNKEIFACLLRAEYVDNIYFFERRIHVQKDRFMRSVINLPAETPLQVKVAEKINLLFDAILSYGQLRKRMSDYAALGICVDEMKMVEQTIDQLFRVIKKGFVRHHFYYDVQPLVHAIQYLDNNYQLVLQVASKEPMAFLLFIASLRAFSEEIASFD